MPEQILVVEGRAPPGREVARDARALEHSGLECPQSRAAAQGPGTRNGEGVTEPRERYPATFGRGATSR